MNTSKTRNLHTNLRLARRFFYFLLIAFITFGATTTMTSCNSKKKLAAERAAAEKQKRIDEAKSSLTALLSDTNMDLEEKKRRLAAIKAQNIDDPEVRNLIAAVESQIEQQEERIRREEEERRRAAEAEKQVESVNEKMSRVLGEIANAPNANAANSKIAEMLQMFESPDTPVLIIIAEENGKKDYDRPTTIEKYLNYIKDQKKAMDRVANVGMNSAGKIKLLELRK
ncbi:MAG: hypothetical protein JJT94_01165 [Bernardetiaceae bacterium]|nr:hypothetical protein [Bernardetiaceae bacterium]